MTQPFVSYRLFSLLRFRAYSEPGDGELEAPGRGLVELDHEIGESERLGVSSEDTRTAMDDLVDADLIHRLTPAQQQELGIRGGDRQVVFVAPLDDLTVATMLLGRL